MRPTPAKSSRRLRVLGFLIVLTLLLAAIAYWWRQRQELSVPEAIDRLNRVRRWAGLEPVELDATLTEGCRRHVEYLQANRYTDAMTGMNPHTESPEKPGYSEAGLLAANSGVIAFRTDPADAIDKWLATLYHRLPLLSPNLKRVGLAADSLSVVMNVISGVEGSSEDVVVLYPANAQAEVPRLFTAELPDPLPPRSPRPAGYPITVQFPEGAERLEDVQVSLKDQSGADLPFHLSHPASPAGPFPQGNSVCAIPIRPLPASVSVEVKVAARVDGKPFSRRWTFTTL